MSDQHKDAPAERVQRFRFRVVAPDGRELVSDVAQVHYPAPAPAPLQAEPAATLATAAPQRRELARDLAQVGRPAPAASQDQPAAPTVEAEPVPKPAEPEPKAEPKAGNFRVSAIFVSVEGQHQHRFKGESEQEEHRDQFAALTLDYELLVPRDGASGQSRGPHRHGPVTIVKEWGAATPQLFSALTRNELLPTVEIDCYGFSEHSAQEGLVHKVKLTDAKVVSIKQVAGGSNPPGLAQLETVAFSFRGIEHMTPEDAVLASDGQVHAPAKARA
jgi:type VI secretion system Hcp family effector